MAKIARDQLDSFLHDGDQAIWSTAALVVALQAVASETHQAAALAVLSASGLDGVTGLGDRDGLASQAAAPIHQVGALLRGEGHMWTTQSDEALLAQGRASAQGAAGFAQFGLPMLTGLQEAFATGARMLDVGTGVAAMAVAYAELFPGLTVVGIDVMPRVLAMAERTVAESSVSDRIILREQDVSSLDDPETYVLAWLPAPFIPEAALGPGVLRVVDALQPGGWLMLGHGKYGGSVMNDAIGRFKTVTYGGTALSDEQAEEMLRSAGLLEVRTVPTPEGAPAITVGRKPTRA
ncbi:SAM-dependent methyltransferase [Nocardioides cynanchi]|uniref:SAM-dependent methyltransferase n=1 Tax=Nocardioides cynanchi TaxID=2558918 RepID=UPI00124430E4|nr:methyltransferase domain-containing protein [Nocardioides cynanchi]